MAHWTATIEVTHTEPEKPQERDQYGNIKKDVTPRSVTEVDRIIIRDKTIDGLRAKIIQHVELIDGNIV